MTRAMKQATKYAEAVRKIAGDYAPAAIVWDKAKCQDKGYDNAEAGVVIESSGFGASDELTVIQRVWLRP